MCRFVAYIGKEDILLANLLVKPNNSLIKQSLLARESRTLTNGDGFGLGWYTPFDKTPALFTSLFPAWNDRNFSYIAKKTRAQLFFAHIRAASTGGISHFNCHPFIYKNWLFMHNGFIPFFKKIKRQISNLLDDDIYSWIKGSTDSELIFALFLQLAKNLKIKNSHDIHNILLKTLQIINELVKQYHKKAVSYFNICITDGKRIVAFRYCTSARTKPETMYFSLSESLAKSATKETVYNYVIIASEKLSTNGFKWQIIPVNHCFMVESNLSISLQKL
ncbi:class II glutamine amidotransferase [Legionella qingyii]|uniref:Class II glutamine amidotransferase n=1 Tax=Legionella qingyii TaxID=2184757 RepID=A0A317U6J5_9GAMM|nr:class II glutamine amidotransferase [Legionella qingyii]PWY56496.1 class II glutamine amidotransferase [Legionella qingyii]PWY57147.1 class II glutamine amidotransferase [Legionella qingyii]RUR25013.1 class II glutamine amidotransferase [Legionella qingyii]RUR28715.1 class II glutamine amidotransferase [Legionella qingyii]